MVLRLFIYMLFKIRTLESLKLRTEGYPPIFLVVVRDQ